MTKIFSCIIDDDYDRAQLSSSPTSSSMNLKLICNKNDKEVLDDSQTNNVKGLSWQTFVRAGN